MMESDIKGNSVKVSTFKSWGYGSSTKYNTKIVEGVEIVYIVSCVLCEKYLSKIKTDPKFKGQINKEVEKFAVGTTNVKNMQLISISRV